MRSSYRGERPSVALVIPAFNATETIADTLRSAAAQTTPPAETIVVDDGSTDATARVAAAFTGVRVVRQPNAGLAGARNAGLREVTSQVVTFLDADDVIRPGYVEGMSRAIRSHEVGSCAYEFLGPGLESLGWIDEPDQRAAELRSLVEFNPFAIGALAFRTDVLRDLTPTGPFDQSLCVHEDWEMLLRLCARGARWAPIVSAPLFGYRLRPGSMSTDIARMGSVGERVIAGAPVEESFKPGAIRRWRLRTLARALAARDAGLCAQLAGSLTPIGETDLPTLAGALRHALCRVDCVGPGAAPALVREWNVRVSTAAGGAGWAATAFALAFGRVDGVPRAEPDLLAECRRAARVVVYGVGRNGRAFMRALLSMRGAPPVAWMDDAPSARAAGARVQPADLSPDDLVVVTPDDHGAMLATLRASGASHVRILARAQPWRLSA